MLDRMKKQKEAIEKKEKEKKDGKKVKRKYPGRCWWQVNGRK
jgi:hypothetical protein